MITVYLSTKNTLYNTPDSRNKRVDRSKEMTPYIFLTLFIMQLIRES